MNDTADNTSPVPLPDPAQAQIAASFVAARRQARALPSFPGPLPASLAAAYRVQDLAIEQWSDRVIGWKVGYIAPERRDDEGDERLLGPMFARALWHDHGGINPIPVFEGGFAAVEAEYVLRINDDARPGKLTWTPEEAAQLPTTLLVGVEVASSPLASINDLGPCAVIADFGNHAGLVLGREIPDWHVLDEAGLHAETWIDGSPVGAGGAARLPGGLHGALAFALTRLARRGRPLRAGELIATGNATGIHQIGVGQKAEVRFADLPPIACRAVPATALAGGTERHG